jgi:hypothetical protein
MHFLAAALEPRDASPVLAVECAFPMRVVGLQRGPSDDLVKTIVFPNPIDPSSNRGEDDVGKGER